MFNLQYRIKKLYCKLLRLNYRGSIYGFHGTVHYIFIGAFVVIVL